MKKSIIIIMLLIFSIFAIAGDINYIYGYNFSNDASTTFSGLKTNITIENELDTLYYKLSIDFFKIDGFDYEIDLGDTYKSLIPSYIIKPSLPWALYILNEGYADVYLNDTTIRFGRFIQDNGSATLYSPSVLLNAHDGINIFEDLKPLPVDGITINGYINDYGYELTFTPKVYDDIPQFILYPKTINENIIAENEATLTYIFKAKHEEVESATEELMKTLLSKGFTQDQINQFLNDPSTLKTIGFTDEKINEIYLGQTLLSLSNTYKVNTITANSTSTDELSIYNSNFESKISMNIMDYDIKLGFVHDHYHFMVPEKIDISYSEDGTGISKTVFYRPNRNSVTIDLQGVSNFFDSISYHGEAAFIMPERNYVIVNTSYYVPNTSKPTETVLTTSSTNVEIFEKYYVKGVFGIEYTSGEEFTFGIEGFNGLPSEELKDHISFGGDTYIKMKINNFNLEGLGLIDFAKINDAYLPGYMANVKIYYSGIDNFEPGISFKYAYAENENHPMKSLETTNSISLNIKAYF
ncbi:hypothetical protein X275_00260 [Marinitoga sp. 1197]|uniref:hypothetical protein n=1 Tax=Marinitoga sp. 1197 TaxID=1428449 RepID=UPI000640C49B|nr:hypothetical protein [Marinitoga sp. 1197]KLO24471.1 hypothetical protein X275_00260 [Marinitoga sp. 1197]